MISLWQVNEMDYPSAQGFLIKVNGDAGPWLMSNTLLPAAGYWAYIAVEISTTGIKAWINGAEVPDPSGGAKWGTGGEYQAPGSKSIKMGSTDRLDRRGRRIGGPVGACNQMQLAHLTWHANIADGSYAQPPGAAYVTRGDASFCKFPESMFTMLDPLARSGMCTTPQMNPIALCFSNGDKTTCSKTTTLLPEVDYMNSEFPGGSRHLAAVLILEKATFCQGSSCTVAKRSFCFVCKEEGRMTKLDGGHVLVKKIRDNCYSSDKHINCRDLSGTSCLSKEGGGCLGMYQEPNSEYLSAKTLSNIGDSLRGQLQALTMTA